MKANLKIAILIDQLFPGAVQKIALKEAKELKKLGHKVAFLVLMRRGFEYQYQDLIKELNIKFLSDYYPHWLRKAFLIPGFRFLTTLHFINPVLAPRFFKEREFDLILSHGTTTTFTAQTIFKKRRIPYAVFVHDPMIYILEKVYRESFLKIFFFILKPLVKFLEKSFLEDSQIVLTQSSFHKERLEKIYNIKSQVIPLGVDYYRLDKKVQGDKILALSSWNQGKKPEFLLRLLEKIPAAQLILAGSWSNKKELEEFKKEVKKNNLENRVEIMADFLEIQKPFLFSRAQIYVHPVTEAFGLGALEAAAAALPVIIPEKSGVTSYFEAGKHGFFPKEGDLDEFTAKIKKLLENPELTQKMGQKAQEVIKEKYTWENHTLKLLKSITKPFEAEKNVIKITALELGHVFKLGLSGGDRLLQAMSSYFPKEFKLNVIISSIGAIHWQKSHFKNFDLHILPPNRFENRGGPVSVFLSYAIRMWQAFRYLKKRGLTFDIIYSSTNILPDVWPAFFAKKKFRHLKWFARVHHLIPPPHKREGKLHVNIVSYLMQFLANRMMRKKADLIGVLNNNLKNELKRKKFRDIQLEVIPGGIDVKRVENYPVLKTSPSFSGIFLGRLHITKGIDDAVEIWQEVVKKVPAATLAFIGEGPEEIKSYLKIKINERHLEKNIKVLEFLPEEELFSTLKKSRLFIFCDHEAGYGLAAAEAMASGLPVIAYDLPIFGDIFKEGFTTVPFKNKKAFSQEIIDLLVQEDLRKSLSQKAKKEAKRHDWSYPAFRFIKLVNYLLNLKSP